MSLVNDIKKLVANSPLFVEESKLKAKASKSAKRGKYGRDAVKIGKAAPSTPLQTASWVQFLENECALRYFLSVCTVVGVGKGTKKLSDFLDCVKVIHSSSTVSSTQN